MYSNYHILLAIPAGAEIDFPAVQQQNHQMMALLVRGKSEASEIAKLMFTSPGVNFALVSAITIRGQAAHSVSIRVESARIGELWAWLWEEKKAWLSSHGLQAVVLQSGTVAWLDGKAGEQDWYGGSGFLMDGAWLEPGQSAFCRTTRQRISILRSKEA